MIALCFDYNSHLKYTGENYNKLTDTDDGGVAISYNRCRFIEAQMAF